MGGAIETMLGVAGRQRLRGAARIIPELLVILACISVIWGAVFATLWHAKVTAIDVARAQSAVLAHAFAESSERISTALDRELLSLRSDFAEKGDNFDLMYWLRTESSRDPMTLQTGVADREGWVVQNSLPMNGKRVSLADRAHFLAHLDDQRDALYISEPVIGRITNRCAVQFTRKLLDGAGAFAGMAMNSVSCEDLSRFYETVDIGEGFILLAGLDGIIRGFGPLRPEVLGTNLNQSADLRLALSARKGTLTVPMPWDGVRRIVSFRRLDQYPLLVMVGYDNERVFRQYRPVRDRALQIGGAASLIIVALGVFWIQQRVRSAASRRALLLTLDNMSQGIVMIDHLGRVPVINCRATQLLDLSPELLKPGRVMPRGEAGRLGLLVEGDDKGPGRIGDGTIRRNGRIIEILGQTLADGGLVRTFTDVTEARIADARIRHMAHHDSLTGLANRTLLSERLAELPRQGDAGGFGLLCVDLDGFKVVNDTLGHAAGDRLLRIISRRLRKLVGGKGLLARTGGDEFTILRPTEAGPVATMAFAASLAEAIAVPVDLDGTQFRLSASVGVAFCPEDGDSAIELMRNADTAMYQAKAFGRGFAVRFNPEMGQSHHEHCMIERDLRLALAENQLEVWFQPRFETGTLRIAGFEALSRWRHPERGLISPTLFIPIAEQCGLIGELGLRVLREACVFAASLPDGRIAVNLSPVQFLSNNLPEIIRDTLAEYHLTPDRLELEITEGVLITDEMQALTMLCELRAQQLHIALDDFGTGYASLSYLRRFPFDRIKIDQSFTQAQEFDGATRAIVESILTMAKRLRLEVTAEGVETDCQLNLLLDQGCPEVQGYMLGRAMPAAGARAFYAAHRAGVPWRQLTAA